MLKPGTHLGSYEIVGVLGAGGMGQVYRARDPELGRDVALKVLSEELAGRPDLLSRLRREARAVSGSQSAAGVRGVSLPARRGASAPPAALCPRLPELPGDDSPGHRTG